MDKIYKSYLFNAVKKLDLKNFIEREVGSSFEKVGQSWKTPCPLHRESQPSFVLKLEPNGIWIFHCLAGETGVLTKDGTIPIRDLAGTTKTVLTRGQRWVEAPFINFGKQRLWKIVVGRNGLFKTIRATDSHDWLVRRNNSHTLPVAVKTRDLLPGHRLAWMFPKKSTVSALSPQGIQHGIVFGDGTISNGMGRINLHGIKNKQLLTWFPLNRTWTPQKGDYIQVGYLPKIYKTLPPLNESAPYLSGFLAGWLAADGHVAKDGTVSLNSSNRNNLEFARQLASRIGIGTYGITCQSRIGLTGKGKTPVATNLYRIHFVCSDLDERFFLLNTHKLNFTASDKKFERRGWVIKSVEETNDIEDVYCAVVPKYHCFTLEDNILTGNCFGCESKGTIIDFCMEYFNESNPWNAAVIAAEKEGLKLDESIVVNALQNATVQDNRQKDVLISHFVTSCICLKLLRVCDKDEKTMSWVARAYDSMNKILNDETARRESFETIGIEASHRAQAFTKGG